jgi:hypothetical protein
MDSHSSEIHQDILDKLHPSLRDTFVLAPKVTPEVVQQVFCSTPEGQANRERVMRELIQESAKQRSMSATA